MIDPLIFAELYSEYDDPVSICDELGVSFEELDKHRKRQGFPPFKGYRQYTAKPKKTIIRREPEEVLHNCFKCQDRRVFNCINCNASTRKNFLRWHHTIDGKNVTRIELLIAHVLLENDCMLSTRQVASEANITWSAAIKYLQKLWERHWIVQYVNGNRRYWQAYSSK